MKEKPTLLTILIIIITLVSIIVIALPKEVDRQTTSVKGTVVMVEHIPAHNTVEYDLVTKTNQVKYHADQYKTYIKYENIIYTLTSKEAYLFCCTSINQTVDCELVTIYYDNDSIQRIITIGGYN